MALAELRTAASGGGVRVLGVDPGTIVTGWGVVDCDARRLVHVASGAIRVGKGELAERLARIYAEICDVIRIHQPGVMSLERNFLARNVQSAFRLGEARGVAMAAAAASAVTLSEYTPATIKKAVVGHGRADKTQVLHAVARLLSVDRPMSADEADALATAACHGLRHCHESKLAQALDGQSPRRGARARRWTAENARRVARRTSS